MTAFNGEIWFLASCIEFYKDEKGLTGSETYDYFRETGAFDYIVNGWEGLHMTGHSYVIDAIDEYIRTHQ